MSNKEKLIEKLGSEEAYIQFMRDAGRKGGMAGAKVRPKKSYSFARYPGLAKKAREKRRQAWKKRLES